MTGFFLSSFQKWREEILLDQATPTVLSDLGYGVLDTAMVETAAYCVEAGRDECHTSFFRLLKADDKEADLRAAVAGSSEGYLPADVFHVDPSSFRQIPGSPFAAGTGPSRVAADAAGKFAYVTNEGSNNISAYAINSASGALTPVPGSPFAAGKGPTAVAVDPTSKFAYVANGGSNNVSAYQIDGGTGALAPVPGSPFAAQRAPFGVATDSAGKFVYVTNLLSNSVSAYAIDSGTGALIPLPGSPFAAGHPVNIPELPWVRYHDGVTQKDKQAVLWL